MKSKFLFMVLCLFSTIIFSAESFKGLPQRDTNLLLMGKYFFDQNDEIGLDKQSQEKLIECIAKFKPDYWSVGTHLKVVLFYENKTNSTYNVEIEGRRIEESAMICRKKGGEIKKETLEKHNIAVPQSE